MAGQPAGPPARHPTGRAQKNNPFCLVGPARPDPFKTSQKRTGPKQAGPGQNGPARFDTPTHNSSKSSSKLKVLSSRSNNLLTLKCLFENYSTKFMNNNIIFELMKKK